VLFCTTHRLATSLAVMTLAPTQVSPRSSPAFSRPPPGQVAEGTRAAAVDTSKAQGAEEGVVAALEQAAEVQYAAVAGVQHAVSDVQQGADGVAQRQPRCSVPTWVHSQGCQ